MYQHLGPVGAAEAGSASETELWASPTAAAGVADAAPAAMEVEDWLPTENDLDAPADWQGAARVPVGRPAREAFRQRRRTRVMKKQRRDAYARNMWPAHVERDLALFREVGSRVRWQSVTWPEGGEDDRARYKAFYNKYEHWVERVLQLAGRRRNVPRTRRLKLCQEARGRFRKLTQAKKGEIVGYFLRSTEVPGHIRDWCVDRFPVDGGEGKGPFLHARHVLLTWNGCWGLMDVPNESGSRTCSMSPGRPRPSSSRTWSPTCSRTTPPRWGCGMSWRR